MNKFDTHRLVLIQITMLFGISLGMVILYKGLYHNRTITEMDLFGIGTSAIASFIYLKEHD